MGPDRPYDAAVVGAGPAGATAAQRLAEGGARVVLFDESHPREKPCGGGISAGARNRFPELEEIVGLGKTGTSLRLVSPAGRVATVKGNKNTFAVDRIILDSHLLQRAVSAGAVHEARKVTEIVREPSGWALRCADLLFRARLLIGADGVHSLVRRQIIGAPPQEHLALGAHALVENLNPPTALIRFFGDRRGFAWVFNRKDRSSVGIGMPLVKCRDWREILERFFIEQAPGRPIPRIETWCLPQASSPEAFSPKLRGEDWCLVGDAAGHADPLTGEGIIYAMWGGALAASAILEGSPARYDALWRDAFLPRFLKHLRLSRWLERRRVVEAALAAGAAPLIGRWIFRALTGDDR